MEGGPDYKTLFLGACTLTVLFGGGLYGLWDRHSQQSVEDNRATNAKQWDRIADLAAETLECKITITRLSSDIARNERAIEELKRAIMENGKRRP